MLKFEDIFFNVKERAVTKEEQQQINKGLKEIYKQEVISYDALNKFDSCKNQLETLLGYYIELCPSLELFQKYKDSVNALQDSHSENDQKITLKSAKETLESYLLLINKNSAHSIDQGKFNSYTVNACYQGAYSNLVHALSAFGVGSFTHLIASHKRDFLYQLAANYIRETKLEILPGNEIHAQNTLANHVADTYSLMKQEDALSTTFHINRLNDFKTYCENKFNVAGFIQLLSQQIPDLSNADAQGAYNQTLNEYFEWLGVDAAIHRAKLCDVDDKTYQITPKANVQLFARCLLAQAIEEKGYVIGVTLQMDGRSLVDNGECVVRLSDSDADPTYEILSEQEIMELQTQQADNELKLKLLQQLTIEQLDANYFQLKNIHSKSEKGLIHLLLKQPTLTQNLRQQLYNYLQIKKADQATKKGILIYLLTHPCLNDESQLETLLKDQKKEIEMLPTADLSRCLLDGIKNNLLVQVRYLLKNKDLLAILNAQNIYPLHEAVACAHDEIIDALLASNPDLLNAKGFNEMTPAFVAAGKGHVKVLQKLHTLGAELTMLDSDGSTIAFVAAQKGHVEVLEKLYELNADLLTQPNKKNITPVWLAACHGQVKVLETLEQFGALNANLNRPSNNGITPAWIAAQNGHAAAFEKLKKLGADLNKTINYDTTPAWIAAQNGHDKVFEKFTKEDVGLLNVVCRNGAITAAWVAAKNGHVKVLEKLGELGADLNQPNKNGATPAFIAAQNGHVDVLQKLYELDNNYNFNRADNTGATPAFVAAKKGHVKVLEKLKDLKADLNQHTLENKATPAIIAAYNGHDKVLEILGKLGADLNYTNNTGATPAIIAAKNGHVKVLEKLGELGADLNKPNKNGATPAFIAAQNGHVDVLQKLYELDNNYNFNRADNTGATPAYVAAEQGHTAALETLKKWVTNLNQPNKNGATPAFIAAQNGHVDVLEKLGDLEQPNGNGITPALIAAHNDKIKVLEKLKALGVDLLNQATKQGDNLTFIAARNGHVEMLKQLKRWDVNVNQANNKGITPAWVAALEGKLDVMHVLFEDSTHLYHSCTLSTHVLRDIANKHECQPQMEEKINQRLLLGDKQEQIVL